MSAAPSLLPVDEYTRHRWHWIQGNEPEVWEWTSRMWNRPGCPRWKTPEQAGAEGWAYIAEAHPPADASGTRPGEDR